MKIQSKSFRSATSAPATLRVEGGATLSCVVLNLSAGGAKIELGPDDVVPNRFHIVAGDLNVDGEADVVWRLPPLLGIRFLTRQAVAAPRPESRPAAGQQPIAVGEITRSPGRSATLK
jgi:hypothetical protein